LPHYFVAARRSEFHCNDYPVARAGNDVDADAILLLGAVCDGISAVVGVSAAGSRWRYAVDGQGRAHEFLPTDGVERRRCAGECEWWRQPVAVATSVLVPGASGSLCVDSSGDGNRCRDNRQ